MIPLVFALAVGCFVSDSELEAAYDRDGDGHQPAQNGGADCDNEDPAVHPDALELCDGLDNNCNGEIDELGAIDGDPWYADIDEDGYGVESETVVACERPATYASEAGDCDPADPAFNPGEEDLCDGLDQDCDGTTDDDAEFSNWYLDNDEDGFGDLATETSACAAPSRHVDNGDDCDDTLASVRPGQTDVCDGVDEDCDGDIDEDAAFSVWYDDLDGDGAGDPGTAVDACSQPPGAVAVAGDCDDIDPYVIELTWFADGDADGFGNPAVSLDQCVAPSGWVLDDTDCDDVDPDVNPAEPEVCENGVDDDCDVQTACGLGDGPLAPGNRAFVALQPSAQAGSEVVLGDFDGDSVLDFVVGAPLLDVGLDIDRGAAFVSYGPHLGSQIDLVLSADASLIGEANGWDTSSRLANAGDVNGDGFADLVIAAPDSDSGGSNSGAAYLVHGPWIGVVDLSSSQVFWEGAADASFGVSVAGGGSVNLDAYADVLVGADGATTVNGQTGCAYLFHGPSPSPDLALASATLVGISAGDYTGLAVGMSDVDGDGVHDAVVGAPGRHAAMGSVYIVHGPATGAIDLSMADAEIVGFSDDGLGMNVDGGPDTDGDGYADTVLAGMGDDARGIVRLFTGSLVGKGATDAIASAAGQAPSDFAAVVELVDDFNGDGFGDLAIGAPSAAGGEGVVFLIYGPMSGTLDLSAADTILRGEPVEVSSMGTALDSGDLDDDGLSDLLLGARSYDGPFSPAGGAAYIVLGVSI